MHNTSRALINIFHILIGIVIIWVFAAGSIALYLMIFNTDYMLSWVLLAGTIIGIFPAVKYVRRFTR